MHGNGLEYEQQADNRDKNSKIGESLSGDKPLFRGRPQPIAYIYCQQIVLMFANGLGMVRLTPTLIKDTNFKIYRNA